MAMMDKAVLISIRPNWCKKILSGYKTLEIRKTRPKLKTPFKCFIYMTKQKKSDNGWLAAVETERGCYYGAGSVIGEFVCYEIERIDVPYPAYQKELPIRILKESCIPYYDLHRYAYHDDVFGWNISDLKIYDTPKQLADFGLSRAPQSWCYLTR